MSYSVIDGLVTPPPVGGRGIVFGRFLSLFVWLFIYLFLCQQDYEKTAGPICMKWVNSGKRVENPKKPNRPKWGSR